MIDSLVVSKGVVSYFDFFWLIAPFHDSLSLLVFVIHEGVMREV